MKEQTKGKRLLSALLCIVILISLVPMAAFAAEPESYKVWLGDTQVTFVNKDNILGDGKASYDPATKTLTLNGYNGSYIKADQPLTINMANGTTNTITVPEETMKHGIHTFGECKLTGGGSLEITVENEDNDGILAESTYDEDGNLIIDMSGDLTVKAGDDGLYADEDLTISGSGDISITAGDEGIYASYGEIYIDVDGDLIVDAGSYGIDSDESSIYIGGSGNLTVKSGDDGIWAYNDIEISGSRNVTVEAVARSLRPYGRLILSGSGSVTATSTEGHAVESDYDGPAVELNGTGSPISFTAGTDVDSQAVYNNVTSDTSTLVGGNNLENYNVTGTPASKNVVYAAKHTHSLTPVAKKEATHFEEGKEAHYTCSCGKYFEDNTGLTEITNFETWGIIEKTFHQLSGWKSDGVNHYKDCEIPGCTDGTFIDYAAHTGGTATCTNGPICTVCSLEYGMKNSDNHSGSTKTLKKDSNQHWYIWDCCNAIDGAKQNHSGGTATCQERAACSICGEMHGSYGDHDYDISTWGYKSAEGHAHCCKTEGCTSHDTVVAHIPGAAATEEAAQTCTECGYELAAKLTHAPMLVEGYEATTESPGKKDYYHCDSCGKNYADVTSMIEIEGDPEEWRVIPMIIAIVDGNGSEWTKGINADLTFKSNADFANFTRVEVDGIMVATNDYTVTEGSTIVTLKASFLETLSEGEHTIVIVSANDVPEAKFTVKAATTGGNTGNNGVNNGGNTNTGNDTGNEKNPNTGAISPLTGDSGNMFMWIALLFVSLGGITAIAVIYKKRKTVKE